MVSRSPIDPRASSHFFREQHERGASSPGSWLFIAEELERATEILWRQTIDDSEFIQAAKVGDEIPPTAGAAAMLLAGLTVENLLKGICVADEPALNEDGEFRLKTHKLLDLAERSHVSLQPDTRRLVERLEAAVEWAGRYPVSLKYEDMMPRTLPNGGFASLGGWRSSDLARWRALVADLRTTLGSRTHREPGQPEADAAV